MYYAGKSFSTTGLELLYAQYNIINDRYNNIFSSLFIKNRELIANMNNHARVSKTISRINNNLNINDFEVYRLYLSLKYFINGEKCEDCYYIKNEEQRQFLQELKNEQTKLSRTEINQVTNEVLNYISQVDDDVNIASETIVRKGILEIMHIALQTSVDDTNVVDTFLDALTDRERDCFKHIEKELEYGNLISISKIENETEYSKTILRTILSKMEKYNIAEVINRGRKGTEINLKVLL